MTDVTFLGTGNFLAPGRYWNSFVLDNSILVEPCPVALPHLRKCGIPIADIEVVVISHFHPDHTFGWPFFLLAAAEGGGGRPLSIVGPPGTEAFLSDMIDLGGVQNVLKFAHANLDLQFVEVDGSWQEAGPLKFRAVGVRHVPHLQCFGYLFARGERVIGYSGDTTPCAGLEELASQSDALVLECNGKHEHVHEPSTHMDEECVNELQALHPDVTIVLTHLGESVDVTKLHNVIVPEDFEQLTL
jgi:ribonuclease BN (tRNA processing enzyme)